MNAIKEITFTHRYWVILQDIQQLMGHANSNTTMTYIALDNAALAEAYNRYSS